MCPSGLPWPGLYTCSPADCRHHDWFTTQLQPNSEQRERCRLAARQIIGALLAHRSIASFAKSRGRCNRPKHPHRLSDFPASHSARAGALDISRLCQPEIRISVLFWVHRFHIDPIGRVTYLKVIKHCHREYLSLGTIPLKMSGGRWTGTIQREERL